MKRAMLIIAAGLTAAAAFLFMRAAQPKRISVELYYYNVEADRAISPALPCSPDAVLPVDRRIRKTPGLIADTLALLLEGHLTAREKAQGFRTEFPQPRFRLRSLTLQDGTLTLVFEDPDHFSSGGACRAVLLRTQIEKTALQFPDVRNVVCLPDEVFQP
jgi:spore germination protein GerM